MPELIGIFRHRTESSAPKQMLVLLLIGQRHDVAIEDSNGIKSLSEKLIDQKKNQKFNNNRKKLL
jgi:hypothetical protein